MNQFIFRNRWIALAFVAMTLLSVYTLVGDEDGGLLTNVAGGIEQRAGTDPAQLTQAPPLPSGPAVVMPQGEEMAMDDTEFVDDSELVDEAGGMDPSPMGESEGGGSETPPPPPIYPAPPAFAGDQVQ